MSEENKEQYIIKNRDEVEELLFNVYNMSMNVFEIDINRILYHRFMDKKEETMWKTFYTTEIKYLNDKEKITDFRITTPMIRRFRIQRYNTEYNRDFVRSLIHPLKYTIVLDLYRDTEEEEEFYRLLRCIDNTIGDRTFMEGIKDKEKYVYNSIIKRKKINRTKYINTYSVKLPWIEDKRGKPIIDCDVIEITKKGDKIIHNNLTIDDLDMMVNKDTVINMVINMSSIWASRGYINDAVESRKTHYMNKSKYEEKHKMYKVSLIAETIIINNYYNTLIKNIQEDY